MSYLRENTCAGCSNNRDTDMKKTERFDYIGDHIRHLREKMGDTADKPKYIKTVWGVGYKIDG